MIDAIDHVVILVNDLDAAITDYSALGFTVVPGGEHADGLSHNALIALADGSYLELIAFKRPPPDEHLFARGYRSGEGLVTFALLPTDIASDVEEARKRGLEMDGPFPGGRVRPGGQRIEWQIARPRTRDLPFLCGDVTPRELRVPGGEAIVHANGVVGISHIGIAVTDLAASKRRYQALMGSEPASAGEAATFVIGRASINLVARPDIGDLPLVLALYTRKASPGIVQVDQAHGVNLAIEYQADL